MDQKAKWKNGTETARLAPLLELLLVFYGDGICILWLRALQSLAKRLDDTEVIVAVALPRIEQCPCYKRHR